MLTNTMDPDRRGPQDPPGQSGSTMPRTADVATVLEAYVERVARLVLHAGSLAERLEQRDDSRHLAVQLAALRDAVTRGERAIVGTVRQHAVPAPRERRHGIDRRVVVRV